MQIKQFTGATIDEVLTQVRAELGDEAVILQTKRVVKGGIGGFFGREGVEVTAAEGLPAGRGRGRQPRGRRLGAPPARDRRARARRRSEEEFVPAAFRRHLESRLAAAEEAEAERRRRGRPARRRVARGHLRPRRRPVRPRRPRAHPGDPRGRPRGGARGARQGGEPPR